MRGYVSRVDVATRPSSDSGYGTGAEPDTGSMESADAEKLRLPSGDWQRGSFGYADVVYDLLFHESPSYAAASAGQGTDGDYKPVYGFRCWERRPSGADAVRVFRVGTTSSGGSSVSYSAQTSETLVNYSDMKIDCQLFGLLASDDWEYGASEVDYTSSLTSQSRW